MIRLHLVIGQLGEKLLVALVFWFNHDALFNGTLDEDTLVVLRSAQLFQREARSLEQLSQHAIGVAIPPVRTEAHAHGKVGVDAIIGPRFAQGLDKFVVQSQERTLQTVHDTQLVGRLVLRACGKHNIAVVAGVVPVRIHSEMEVQFRQALGSALGLTQTGQRVGRVREDDAGLLGSVGIDGLDNTGVA